MKCVTEEHKEEIQLPCSKIGPSCTSQVFQVSQQEVYVSLVAVQPVVEVQASSLHSAIQKEGRKDCLKLQREHGRKDKEVSQTLSPSFLSWLVSCTHSLCVSWGGTLGSFVKELASHWLAEVKCGQLGSASMSCS